MIAAAVLMAGVLGAVLLDAGAVQTGAVPASRTSPVPEVSRTPLLPADSGQAPLPTTSGLRAVLQTALANPLISRLGLSIVDVQSGQPLLELGGGRPVVPASTAKLITAVAALTVLGPDQRFTTRVVAGTGTDVILVGGGDPTLRGPKSKGSGARLADLAAQLTRRGKPIGRVLVDDSLFAGARTGPGWKPGYVTAGDVSPVSSLELVDTE
ncbi:MAG: D-alanyl-D-alanine carboxypeptidase, partial [Frankiales bacterium]|nr:D-alanyl-D-alanine carboxypeptidase [Frankiales bacterium]